MRAKRALPILVRQAKTEQRITYTDLAIELEMPNPRNLNFVLGAIGNSLKKLEEILRERIPLINVIVVNKNNLLPGKGIDYFFTDTKRDRFKNCSNEEKKRLLEDDYLPELYNFQHWDKVLSELKLSPIEQKEIIPKFKPKKRRSWQGWRKCRT